MEKVKKRCVVLSGSGVSEESGIPTFRGTDGLWEGFRVEDVATPEAYERDPEMVLRFYNVRRQALRSVEPNAAHRAIAALEEKYAVTVITQNVDNLHERAGSSDVLHLHGELSWARSPVDPDYRVHLGDKDLNIGDTDPSGHQLRPDVVWFGEDVPAMAKAIVYSGLADILIVIGTSLLVYPAASLVDFVPEHCEAYIIDPDIPEAVRYSGFTCIEKKAIAGMEALMERL